MDADPAEARELLAELRVLRALFETVAATEVSRGASPRSAKLARALFDGIELELVMLLDEYDV